MPESTGNLHWRIPRTEVGEWGQGVTQKHLQLLWSLESGELRLQHDTTTAEKFALSTTTLEKLRLDSNDCNTLTVLRGVTVDR
eukprot:3429259-Rhodomonas_salina.1